MLFIWQQSNLEISREELINAQQSYDIIKNKVEADLAAKDELFQAELNLATALFVGRRE